MYRFIGFPVFPLGRGEPRKFDTVEAMSEIKTGTDERPGFTLHPYQCMGAWVSYTHGAL